MLLTLTDIAAGKVRELLEKEGRGDSCGLRVEVVSGGCNGLRYELGFDDGRGESDLESEQHGVRIRIDEQSAAHLDEATLDYVDGLNESGFKMMIPNAQSTCGCGESFDV